MTGVDPACGALRALAFAAVLLAQPARASDEAVVRRVEPLGPYLEIHLSVEGDLLGRSDRSILVLADPICTRIARPEAQVAWVSRGFPGRIEAGGEACEGAGILDLEAWRDRQPRPQVRLIPRKTARWEILHRDGRRALLRGRFPLAPLVGMTGSGDLVAVVADDARCAAVLARREGSLEYRVAGREAYVLLAEGSRCHLLGFARPPSPERAGGATSFATDGAEDAEDGEGPAQSW